MTEPPAIPVAASGRSALEVARSCAQEAGELARARFRQPQEVTSKGRGNLVTETDFEVESLIKRTLAQEFPEHSLLSEETASETDSAGWCWVADPIDGTRNFVSGIPFFCINLALCYDGETVVAVTHDPNHGETFWAERGRGAWVNDQPIRASDTPTVAASVLGIDLGYNDDSGRASLRMLQALFPGIQCIRIPGSAALGLAYAACGRYDLFLHRYLFPWDVVSGLLLVKEAGGTITTLDGGPATLRSPSVIAGSPQAHADLLRWLAEHRAELDPADGD